MNTLTHGRRGMAVVVLAFLVAGRISGLPTPVSADTIPVGLVTQAHPSTPAIALTFDGGPSIYTPRILGVLNRLHVPATFFVVGRSVRAHPAEVRQEVLSRDQIGNNTYSYRDLESLSTPKAVAQLASNQSAVFRAAGIVPRWFRPPYGDVDARVVSIGASLGLRAVTWSVDSLDIQQAEAQSIVSNVVSNVHSGSIVLLHDGGGAREQTVLALPRLIRDLRQEGYQFGTLDEVFGLAPIPPCVPDATLLFSRAGIPAYPSHAIYRAWGNRLCLGISFGPATSREYRLGRHLTAQNFRRTAHILEVSHQTGQVSVVIMWSWASAVFSARHIAPKFGSRITQSWLSNYLRYIDWGPALTRERKRRALIVQHFLDGWAIESPNGSVHWSQSLTTGQSKP